MKECIDEHSLEQLVKILGKIFSRRTITSRVHSAQHQEILDEQQWTDKLEWIKEWIKNNQCLTFSSLDSSSYVPQYLKDVGNRELGMENFIEKIKNSNARVMLIMGRSGMGKSEWLKQLGQKLLNELNQHRIVPIYLSGSSKDQIYCCSKQDITEIGKCLKDLATEINSSNLGCSVGDFTILVMLDAFEKLSEGFQEKLINEMGRLVSLVGGIDVKYLVAYKTMDEDEFGRFSPSLIPAWNRYVLQKLPRNAVINHLKLTIPKNTISIEEMNDLIELSRIPIFLQFLLISWMKVSQMQARQSLSQNQKIFLMLQDFFRVYLLYELEQGNLNQFLRGSSSINDLVDKFLAFHAGVMYQLVREFEDREPYPEGKVLASIESSARVTSLMKALKLASLDDEGIRRALMVERVLIKERGYWACWHDLIKHVLVVTWLTRSDGYFSDEDLQNFMGQDWLYHESNLDTVYMYAVLERDHVRLKVALDTIVEKDPLVALQCVILSPLRPNHLEEKIIRKVVTSLYRELLRMDSRKLELTREILKQCPDDQIDQLIFEFIQSSPPYLMRVAGHLLSAQNRSLRTMKDNYLKWWEDNPSDLVKLEILIFLGELKDKDLGGFFKTVVLNDELPMFLRKYSLYALLKIPNNESLFLDLAACWDHLSSPLIKSYFLALTQCSIELVERVKTCIASRLSEGDKKALDLIIESKGKESSDLPEDQIISKAISKIRGGENPSFVAGWLQEEITDDKDELIQRIIGHFIAISESTLIYQLRRHHASLLIAIDPKTTREKLDSLMKEVVGGNRQLKAVTLVNIFNVYSILKELPPMEVVAYFLTNFSTEDAIKESLTNAIHWTSLERLREFLTAPESLKILERSFEANVNVRVRLNLVEAVLRATFIDDVLDQSSRCQLAGLVKTWLEKQDGLIRENLCLWKKYFNIIEGNQEHIFSVPCLKEITECGLEDSISYEDL